MASKIKYWSDSNTLVLSFANTIFCQRETDGRERKQSLNIQYKKKAKNKTDRTAHGSVKVPAEIDYRFKAWHKHKVELNTSISNHSSIFS